MQSFFRRNRDKVYSTLNEGDAVILFAGNAPTKRGDEKYFFTPDRNFYYLTGIDRENFIFFMANILGERQEYLYIEPSNEKEAKWIGEVLSAKEAKSISGIDNIKYIDSFFDSVAEQKKRISTFFVDATRGEKDETIEKSCQGKEVKDISLILANFRTIKEPEEIKLIEDAVEITRLGIEEMMKNARPNIMEYEIEAYYDYILKKNGVKDKAFQTILASGRNGTILHYGQNDKKVVDGSLVLVDAGAQVGWYNGDISRTFPANGKFSERQKLVYNIVLNGQKHVLDMIKPKVPMPSLNEALKDYYFEELSKIGLVKTKEDVSKYYYHNVGHFLGALTHDVGDRTTELKEGMVLTVEPGLYIEEWEIGIRIEDDILVTKNGYRNLSEKMIKTVDEIETFMAGD